MKQISSRATFFHKYVMPILYLAVFFFVLNSAPWQASDPIFSWLIFAIPAFLVITQIPIWRSADTVYDCGDHLLVRKGGFEDRIPLGNVTRVNELFLVNPTRITLLLGIPCRFGDRISFLPSYETRLFFMRSKIAKDLTRRIEAEHTRQGF